MGWYSAVGRPLFFALPPETAHRLAGATAGAPAPMAPDRRRRRRPALATYLAGIPLRNPIGLAAGFDKTCAHLDALGALGFGYVVGGTITRAPRAGNAEAADRSLSRSARRWRTRWACRTPAPRRAAAHLRRSRRRRRPRFVSLADEDRRRTRSRRFELLAPLRRRRRAERELSERVAGGAIATTRRTCANWSRAMRARPDRPVFVKLPPFATDVERDVVLALARDRAGGGRAGLTCSNTRPVRGAAAVGGAAAGSPGAALWQRTPGDRRRRCGRPPVARCRSTRAAGCSRLPTTSRLPGGRGRDGPDLHLR